MLTTWFWLWMMVERLPGAVEACRPAVADAVSLVTLTLNVWPKPLPVESAAANSTFEFV